MQREIIVAYKLIEEEPQPPFFECFLVSLELLEEVAVEEELLELEVEVLLLLDELLEDELLESSSEGSVSNRVSSPLTSL